MSHVNGFGSPEKGWGTQLDQSSAGHSPASPFPSHTGASELFWVFLPLMSAPGWAAPLPQNSQLYWSLLVTPLQNRKEWVILLSCIKFSFCIYESFPWKGAVYLMFFMSTDLTFVCHLGKVVTFIPTTRTCYCPYISFYERHFFAPKKQDFICLGF